MENLNGMIDARIQILESMFGTSFDKIDRELFDILMSSRNLNHGDLTSLTFVFDSLNQMIERKVDGL